MVYTESTMEAFHMESMKDGSAGAETLGAEGRPKVTLSSQYRAGAMTWNIKQLHLRKEATKSIS